MASIMITDLTESADLSQRQMQTVRGGVFDKASPKIFESWKVEEGESWKVEEAEGFAPLHRLNMVQVFPNVLQAPMR